MTDELNEKVDTGEQVEDMTQDYLAAIKELKQNSVDRSSYDALKAENKKLLDSIVNGYEIVQEPVKKEVSIKELRDHLCSEGLTNLDYISTTLALRNAVIKSGGEDPFVPSSSQYAPTGADYARATKVAQVLQEMVDVANGNPEVFRNEYLRRVKEINIPQRNNKR